MVWVYRSSVLPARRCHAYKVDKMLETKESKQMAPFLHNWLEEKILEVVDCFIGFIKSFEKAQKTKIRLMIALVKTFQYYCQNCSWHWHLRVEAINISCYPHMGSAWEHYLEAKVVNINLFIYRKICFFSIHINVCLIFFVLTIIFLFSYRWQQRTSKLVQCRCARWDFET